MKGPELRAEAIVLGVVDYGDSDRVVTLLTRERGRLPAFAAGARKSKRRFAGALDPFTRLAVRLSEGKGELYFLASCEVLSAHAGLRADLGRIGHAGYAAELCRELCREREPHPEIYD
ncbi:MAG TPA: DNA repair protein RecO, partial [Vulgatibacter sp.]